MNGYPNYPQQRQYGQRDNGAQMQDMPVEDMGMGMGMSSMDFSRLQEGQQLDDYIAQTEKESRRKSMPVYGGMPMNMEDPDMRRFSTMDFNNVDLNGYQFNPQTGSQMAGMMSSDTSYPHNQGNNLQINTQFANQNPQYPNMSQGASGYDPNASLDMDLTSPYHTMPLGDPSLQMMGSDMNMYPGPQFQSMGASPMVPDFMNNPMSGPLPDARGTNMQSMDGFTPSLTIPTDPHSAASSRTHSHEHSITPVSRSHSDHTPNSQNPRQVTPVVPTQGHTTQLHDAPSEDFARMTLPKHYPSTMTGNPHVATPFKNAYSSSGFNILEVLNRVFNRPNPQIDLGPVDLSCAFVVCDAQRKDEPIVYCSDNFVRLTGYGMDDIINKNCRFLQDPNGIIKPGQERKHTDQQSVAYLKRAIVERTEAQVSLLNYRRGGQPFVNLLTMVPIRWDPADEDVRYFVGFQVDLVESPDNMKYINPDGSCSVQYQRALTLPPYHFSHANPRPRAEIGQTISKDEVSQVLAQYSTSGDSEISRHLWDKVLLENADDVIHVLSLKGLFLYLSPSSNKVLEYDPSELVGLSLSTICHPSDIVPVTRELKETTNGVSVNIVFRIRRKHNGYMWFEGHGSLHTEQGKGRKCIILVGRQRPVYTLKKTDIAKAGGIGTEELWSKMSTSGMFLFVSGNVRQLLDKQPEELVGTSIQGLMRPESKQNFNESLKMTRSGFIVEKIEHEMINRRGQVLKALTTIYPGDAEKGEKPTFLVAQTRLMKHHKRPPMYTKDSGDSNKSLHSDNSAQHRAGGNTPGMSHSGFRLGETPTAAFSSQATPRYPIGHQDDSLASDANIFDELRTTRSTSWQYELRQMEKRNRYLAEEVQSLLAAKKKRKRRKGAGRDQKSCANCHTREAPEWRRGPSGERDLCNSCGLKYAKQIGRNSPRNSSAHSSDKGKKSPRHSLSQPPSLLPNVHGEAGSASMQSPIAPLAQGEKRAPSQRDVESHANKISRMEAVSHMGYGGGIPSKIDEEGEMLE